MKSVSHNKTSGFTIVEVVIAAVIMAVGLTAAAICLQLGVRNYDTARKTSQVTQILQDEAERLRLLNWAAINQLPASASVINELPATFDIDPLQELLNNRGLQITRTVQDVPGYANMKQIVLSASWTGLGGTTHSRTLQFRYTEGGTSDYYYGTAN